MLELPALSNERTPTAHSFAVALAVLATTLTSFPAAQEGQPARDPNRPVSVFVIDMAENDLQLTKPADGVRFDIDGNGTAIQVGWTKAGSDDAFLFLDTNANGKVDHGRELIGSGWRKIDGTRVTGGDEALMVIQGLLWPLPLGPVAPENEQYAWVDENDEVFHNLRLWTDSNHNGQSEASELQTLQQATVLRIFAGFRLNRRRIHESGNAFLFEGHLYLRPASGEARMPGGPPPQYRYQRRMVSVEFARVTAAPK